MKVNPVRNNEMDGDNSGKKVISNGVNPLIFRAYDIRGIYPDELSEEVAGRIAKAYMHLFPYAQRLLVAYDTRPSSPALAEAFVSMFEAEGREVVSLGVAPDPLFYFSLFHYGYDGGVMVSGSHNLGAYNGMSLSVQKQGSDIPKDVVEEDLEKIRDMVVQDEKA